MSRWFCKLHKCYFTFRCAECDSEENPTEYDSLHWKLEEEVRSQLEKHWQEHQAWLNVKRKVKRTCRCKVCRKHAQTQTP